MIIISSIIGFMRLDAVSNTQLTELTRNKSEVVFTAKTVSDLTYRANSNPFNTKGAWELSLATKTLSDSESSWQVAIGVLAIFDSEVFDIPFGSLLQFRGVAEKSYRNDYALIVRVTDYRLVKQPGRLNQTINTFRENFYLTAQKVNFSATGLIPGLVSGDTRLQSVEFSEDMERTGLTHLTAVSGGNIAILLAVFIWFFKRLHLSRKTVFVLSVLILGCFLILVRFEPSALRATVMGLIGVWTLTFGGPRTGLGALIFSTYFLLLIDPWLAINWGFILSVFATLGLIVIAPEIQKLWIKKAPNSPRFIVLLFSLTLSAQLITYPLLGFMVGEISLISLLANMLAMPLVAWVSVFGFLALITASLIPPLAIFFVYLALPGAYWIEQVAMQLAKLPFAQVAISGQVIVLVLVLVAVAWRLRAHHNNRMNQATES